MKGLMKTTAALAAFALLLVVMGIGTQSTVNAQGAPNAYAQTCDPYPDRTSHTELGVVSLSCTDDGGDNSLTPTASTYMVTSNRISRPRTNGPTTGAIKFVPRSDFLRTDEFTAFPGDRVTITASGGGLEAATQVVLIDNTAPNVLNVSPVTPLTVKGGVTVTFSAEFTDAGAGFLGSGALDKAEDGADSLILGSAEDLADGTNQHPPEGGVHLVVAGQRVSLAKSNFTAIDGGWRVTKTLGSTAMQSFSANVPWYFEAADRANNIVRISSSVSGSGAAVDATGFADARFSGSLPTGTFTGSSVRITATFGDDTETGRARMIDGYASETGAFTLTERGGASDLFTANGSCPFGTPATPDDPDTEENEANGDANGRCALTELANIKYEILGTGLVTVDSVAPMLETAETGVGYNSGTKKEVTNSATSLKLVFADSGRYDGTGDAPPNNAADNAGSGIDPATVTASAFTVTGNTVESAVAVGNTVYLTLGTPLGTTDTPSVTVAVGSVKDKAGNAVSNAGVPKKATDNLGAALELSRSAAVSKDKVTITITPDEALTGLPRVWIQRADRSGNAAIDTDSDGNGTKDGFESGVRQTGVLEYALTYDGDDHDDGPSGEYNVYVEATDSTATTRTAGDAKKSSNAASFNFEIDTQLNKTAEPVFEVAGTKVDNIADNDNDSVDLISSMIITVKYDKEAGEYARDSYPTVELTSAVMKVTVGEDTETTTFDLNTEVHSADNIDFTIPLSNPREGDYELTVKAVDTAGNTVAAGHKATWTIKAPGPVFIDLSPGWNLISLPFQPGNPAINSIIPADHPVDIVMTYDNFNQAWLVSRRDADSGNFMGDIPVITANTAYFVRTTTFQKLSVHRPPLATASAPPPPPSIVVVEGWNLVSVVSNDQPLPEGIAADSYFGTLASGSNDGWLKALTFNPATRTWTSIAPGDMAAFAAGADNPCTGKPLDKAAVENGTEPCQVGNYRDRSTTDDNTPETGTPGEDDFVAATGGDDGYIGEFDGNDMVNLYTPVVIGKGYWLYATADGVIIP